MASLSKGLENNSFEMFKTCFNFCLSYSPLFQNDIAKIMALFHPLSKEHYIHNIENGGFSGLLCWTTGSLGSLSSNLPTLQRIPHSIGHHRICFVCAFEGPQTFQVHETLVDMQGFKNWWLPTRKLTYLILGKGQSSSNILGGDMLVPSRVNLFRFQPVRNHESSDSSDWLWIVEVPTRSPHSINGSWVLQVGSWAPMFVEAVDLRICP